MGQAKTRDRSNGDSELAKMAQRTFRTRVDIPEEKRHTVIELLNQQLADTFDLFSQTKQAHWNVKGPNFYQLHELYDELAEALLPHIDAIAERVTALGGFAMGTARMAASASRLQDYPQNAVNDLENVEALAACYASVAASTREASDQAEQQEDMDTNDLLIEVSRDLDKFLWFLEAHLHGQGR
jgi:starvation-inducible DNA-binding protein